MAADTPLNKLVLSAASVADDVGYAALADLAHVLGEVTADYRIIGGHMVTMLAARWQLGAELYRETGDVDLGVPPIVARDHNIVDRLKDLGYAQVAGNRFTRRLSDVRLSWRAEIIHRRTHSSTYSSRHTRAGPGRTSRSPSICLLPKFQGFRSRWHAPR
jgi:hypothetical protein